MGALSCYSHPLWTGHWGRLTLSLPHPHRDGGLKREKVKDAFKEEQQKLYSKMISGNHEDRSRS